MNSEVSEDIFFKGGLEGGLGVVGCILVLGVILAACKWNTGIDNAAPGSFGLYRFIAARCINLLLQRPHDFGSCE